MCVCVSRCEKEEVLLPSTAQKFSATAKVSDVLLVLHFHFLLSTFLTSVAWRIHGSRLGASLRSGGGLLSYLAGKKQKLFVLFLLKGCVSTASL